jgi:tetratricopeptide (TPR) repeat protein
VHGERHLSLAAAYARLQSLQLSSGAYQRADSTAETAIAMMRQLSLERNPQILPMLNDLGLSRAYQGDNDSARALLHRVVALDTALFGSAHPDLAAHLENLGQAYDLGGFLDSNIAILKQVLAMRRAMLADDNPAIGRTLFNMAATEWRRNDYAAAQPLYEEALARMRRAYGPEHTDVVWATAALGRNEYELERMADAERHLGWAIGVTDPDGRLAPSDYARMVPTMVKLLMAQRRWGEAEPLALRVLAIRDSLGDTTFVARAAAQVAALYEGWGKPARAVEFRRRAGPTP